MAQCKFQPLKVLLLGLACASAQAAAPLDSLKVLNYNLWQWNMGVTRLGTLIRAATANIVGLQEAWVPKNNDQLGKDLAWTVLYGGKDSPPGKSESFWINGYFMPQVLTSAFSVKEKRYFNIVDYNREGIPNPTKTLQRGATLGKLTAPNANKEFYVLVLHLNPYEDAEAVNEIKELLVVLDSLSRFPTFVMGDFNTRSHIDGDTGPGAEVHRLMAAHGFVDSYAAIHQKGNRRIDFIYANKYLKPVKSIAVVEGVFGSRGNADSDHPAVYSEFVFTSGCTDAKSKNYDAFAVLDDGSCQPSAIGSDGRRLQEVRETPQMRIVRSPGSREIHIAFASPRTQAFRIVDSRGAIQGEYATDSEGKARLRTDRLRSGVFFLMSRTGGELLGRIAVF